MPSSYGKTLTKPTGSFFDESTLIGYTYAPPHNYKPGHTRGPSSSYVPAELDAQHVKDMIKKLDKEFADPNIRTPLWRWEPKPSVYYKNGHVTLQHERRENLGYTYASHTWHWLFFGNVPRTVWEDCGKRLYPRLPPDPRPGKLQFAARARATKPPGFGSYSWSDGLRTEWAEKGATWQTNSASGRGDLLVEIWIQNKLQDVFRPQRQVDEHLLKSHPSRGHFYWVAGDKAMRSALHDLVGEMVKRWPAAFKQRGSPLH